MEVSYDSIQDYLLDVGFQLTDGAFRRMKPGDFSCEEYIKFEALGGKDLRYFQEKYPPIEGKSKETFFSVIEKCYKEATEGILNERLSRFAHTKWGYALDTFQALGSGNVELAFFGKMPTHHYVGIIVKALLDYADLFPDDDLVDDSQIEAVFLKHLEKYFLTQHIVRKF